MDETPKRRWFRFRLSTVLILTAIVAWGMACRPYTIRLWHDNLHGTRLYFGPLPAWILDVSDALDRNAIPGLVFWLDKNHDGLKSPYGLNPRLRRPTAALLTVLAWKSAWAWQFSLRRLFGTVTLFCLFGLALQSADTDSEVGILATLSVFPLLGAAFGSLFKRAWEGALAGVAAMVVQTVVFFL
jgi:hypothetical protein